MNIQRVPFNVPVTAYDSSTFTLCGYRIPNPGKTPLILWPGFFQNGYCWDLTPGSCSLAEYLQENGFDIWIIHSRGTGGSGGTHERTALDDFAACDIPAVIEYIGKQTGMKPVYAGHSQGGITALLSMMGAVKRPDGSMLLSNEEALRRQSLLTGLVTVGSYPDFKFSKPLTGMVLLAQQGLTITIFGTKITLIPPKTLLSIVQLFNRIPVPIPLSLRIAMIASKLLRILLFPLTWFLNAYSLSSTWEFLYHIPNVDKTSRIRLFYLTMNASYSGIITQFFNAVNSGQMLSSDGKVNYSNNYDKILLPVSYVSMARDTLADPPMMQKYMFANTGSPVKHYVEWMDLGHEDFFMNTAYFPGALSAIRAAIPNT